MVEIIVWRRMSLPGYSQSSGDGTYYQSAIHTLTNNTCQSTVVSASGLILDFFMPRWQPVDHKVAVPKSIPQFVVYFSSKSDHSLQTAHDALLRKTLN